MASDPSTKEQVLTQLAETPRRIAGLTAGLARDQLHTPPDHDEWSVNDVLAHLRSCADVWGTCIETILAEDRPEIRAISPRTWIKQTDYPDLEFGPSFRAFTEQRSDLLAVLEPLKDEAWSRAATVKSVGKSFEHTVLSYADRLARHERSHLRQIENIVSSVRASHDQPARP